MNIKKFLNKFLNKRQRKKTATIWLIANIAYDIVRTIAVSHFFRNNGINIYFYFVCVLLFSAIFSYSSFYFVTSVVDRKSNKVALFGTGSLLAFFAPDIYIIIAGRNLSGMSYMLLTAYLAVTVTVASLLIFKDIKTKISIAKPTESELAMKVGTPNDKWAEPLESRVGY